MATKDKDRGEPYVDFRAKTNKRLADVEERLDGHDAEIADLDADILAVTKVSETLAEVCLRASKRISARLKLRKISRRRSE